jgi:predicted DNA-binding transcriptional regulator YafY
MNRIDRLTAILVHLQSKRIVKAEEISERFEISLRTVYRDVKALMEAGVPIGSEAGKGYFIVDGYHLPPVMFTQEEASAIQVAGKIVEKMADKSIREAFTSALLKIKAVLNESEKDHLEALQSHIEISNFSREPHFDDRFLTDIQKCAVDKEVVRIEYYSNYQGELTDRDVEPLGLFYYGHAWHMIGWCRLRNGYRDFRTDRIKSLKKPGVRFDARNLLSLQEYLMTVVQSNREVQKVVVKIHKSVARYMGNSKYVYGFASEEELEQHHRITFLTAHLHALCRYLLMCGSHCEIESPEEAKHIIRELIEELSMHYAKQSVLS